MASATTDRRQGLTSDKGVKAPVATVATTSVVLSGEQTINGYACHAVNAAGYPDRVLCIAQANPVDNGVWDVQTGAWTRSMDSNNNLDLAHGTMFVVAGGSYEGTVYQLQTPDPIQPGTTSMTFAPNINASGPLTAALVSFAQSGAGAASRNVLQKLQENSQSLTDYFVVGQTDYTTALLDVAAAVGNNGDIYVPPGNFPISTSATISVRRMIFAGGAVLVPAPGTFPVIDAHIVAGNYKIFDSGKTVFACDCDASSTTLRTWTYGFESTDAGKNVCLPYGGALTGAAPAGQYVQNRLAFNTTISAYSSDGQVTLAAGPTTAIRQDYVVDGGYAPLNTGIAIVGNGAVTITTKCHRVNVMWFGAVGDGSTDDAVNQNKAYQSSSRKYGGLTFWHPDGTYINGRELKIDVGVCALKSEPRAAIFRRANGVALERMNNITCVWRGRYGGGGPTKAAENWTFLGLSNSYTASYWLADWCTMTGLVIDGPVIDGNKANQPALTPGSGVDSWDAGLSTMYTKRVLIRSTSSFINTIRWGAALSTQSDDSVCEDGVYFDSCGEGGFYAETSSNIVCGAIKAGSCVDTGWNMGAITFNAIVGGAIKSPMIRGGNNGIYIRNGSTDIDIDIGACLNCLNNAVWLFDESLGSNHLKNITVRGGSINGSANGLIASYVDGLTVVGIKGAAITKGIYIDHTTKLSVTHCPVSGGTRDIEISGGVTTGVIAHNPANVALTGTSATYLTFIIPSGFSYDNSTASGSGYVSVQISDNASDGNARWNFSKQGGITVPSAWNFYPIIFGSGATIWEDAGGNLRYKATLPTTPSDGKMFVLST